MAYSYEKLNPYTTLILDDPKEALILIEGDQKIALIDTGMDAENLKDYIESIAGEIAVDAAHDGGAAFRQKPIMVLLTHGHIDHIARCADFEDVYMDPADMGMYTAHRSMVMADPRPNPFNFMEPEKVKPLTPGGVVDLGGVSLKVIPCYGHTPGSVLFADLAGKLVYTGDAIGSGCGGWMQIDGCLDYSVYKENVQAAITMMKECGIDASFRFVGGHYGQDRMSLISSYNPVTFTMFEDVVGLCELMLSGKAEFTQSEFMSVEGCIPYYTRYQTAELIVIKERIK